MQILFVILMFIWGAAMGSFLCCQAWRLRLRLQGKKIKNSRSVCLRCHHQLKWYENLPIISWLAQGGKCRHCGQKIGALEIISELSVGTALALLATTINVTTATAFEWGIFVITIAFMLALCFLAIYDGKWGELPTPALILAIMLALSLAALRIWSESATIGLSWAQVLDTLYSVAILGGIYLLLYLVSRGRWVGDGDWLLGLAIGAALSSPWLALCALFIANFSACLIMYPVVRKRKTKKIYFGPFLVLAFVVSATFANFLLSLVVW
ncbi:prepilin peptidase [Candidatus Saccharibacteria bacterium]|nr:prepilin peptidase [Candidatus Saccharibacteria bacterium]